jgi:hypothetical protein
LSVRGTREGKESRVATGAHQWGRGRLGECDLVQRRAAGDLGSDSSPHREEGDGPAGLLGRLGQAGFGWAASLRLGHAGVGEGTRLPGRTRFPAGFRPSTG